jgi:O-antigen ligase
VLAVLLPAILEQSRKMAKSNAGLFFAILIASMHIGVIILSGSRNALIMLAMAVIGWFIYLLFITRSINWRRLAIVIAVGVPIVAVLSFVQPTRHDTLINVPATDLKALDKISNHRLSLWEAAFRMAQDHWINGIGPRGFRYVYGDYRPVEGKYNYDYNKKGSTHPHFALLEITAETGLIGLTSILTLLFLLFKKLNRLSDVEKLAIYPWFLGVAIAIVSNIAKAFYSTFWMTIVLFMIFIGIANISGSHEKIRHL